MRIINEDELRAMQLGGGAGGKFAKPKKAKKKQKHEDELDVEDLALIEIDQVRRKKEHEFVKRQLRPDYAKSWL